MEDLREDTYADFAEVYDLFYRHDEDVKFYVSIARKCGDPVLELACGTGRVLIPIAREGFKITGLDISDSMLKVLKRKLEKEPDEVKQRIKIVKGDMRNFELGQKFKLIILPFSSIVGLLSEDDVLSTFKMVKNHLMDSGLFVFDTFIPNFEYLSKKSRTFFDVRRIDENSDLLVWEKARYDLTKNLIEVDRYVLVLEEEGLRRYKWSFVIRYWFKTELELLLKLAGFNKVHVYGGFNFEEYSYDKGRMVFIAKV